MNAYYLKPRPLIHPVRRLRRMVHLRLHPLDDLLKVTAGEAVHKLVVQLCQLRQRDVVRVVDQHNDAQNDTQVLLVQECAFQAVQSTENMTFQY